MSYATVEDVESLFPRFVPNQVGSISDAQIQGWLDDGTSLVHSAFAVRGIDTDNLATPLATYLGNTTFTVAVGDQPEVLRDMVRNYGVYKLGMAIFATLNAAEQSITRGAYNAWQYTMKLIAQGGFDVQFAPLYARVVDISPGFVGVAGAEVDNRPSAYLPPDGLPRYYWMSQIF